MPSSGQMTTITALIRTRMNYKSSWMCWHMAVAMGVWLLPWMVGVPGAMRRGKHWEARGGTIYQTYSYMSEFCVYYHISIQSLALPLDLHRCFCIKENKKWAGFWFPWTEGIWELRSPEHRNHTAAVMQMCVLSWDAGVKEELVKTICILDKIP